MRKTCASSLGGSFPAQPAQVAKSVSFFLLNILFLLKSAG